MGKLANVINPKNEEIRQRKCSYAELPKLNPNIECFDEDILYHIALGNNSHDLPKMFGDIKFVVLGGTPNRMENFAYYIMNEIGYELPSGTILNDITRLSRRYAMFKVGPVLSVSHGIGMPSIGILINELIKLMYHAKVKDPIFIRIGTSGGLNTPVGTVVVTENVLNDFLEPYYETIILGNIMKFPATLDIKIVNEILSFGRNHQFEVRKGTTFCSDNFYEGSGRSDGAICEFSQQESQEFYHRLIGLGVVNIEMESLAFVALTHRAGIRSAVVTVVLNNRMETDSIQQRKETLDEWHLRPFKLVGEFIKNELNNSKLTSKTMVRYTSVNQLKDDLSNFDKHRKVWSDSSRKNSSVPSSGSPISENLLLEYNKVRLNKNNTCLFSVATDDRSPSSQSTNYLQSSAGLFQCASSGGKNDNTSSNACGSPTERICGKSTELSRNQTIGSTNCLLTVTGITSTGRESSSMRCYNQCINPNNAAADSGSICSSKRCSVSDPSRSISACKKYTCKHIQLKGSGTKTDRSTNCNKGIRCSTSSKFGSANGTGGSSLHSKGSSGCPFHLKCGAEVRPGTGSSNTQSRGGVGSSALSESQPSSKGCLEGGSKKSTIKADCASQCENKLEPICSNSKNESTITSIKNKGCSCAITTKSKNAYSRISLVGGGVKTAPESKSTFSKCLRSSLAVAAPAACNKLKEDISRSTLKLTTQSSSESKPNCTRRCLGGGFKSGRASLTSESKSDCSRGCIRSSSKVTTSDPKRDCLHGPICFGATLKADANITAIKKCETKHTLKKRIKTSAKSESAPCEVSSIKPGNSARSCHSKAAQLTTASEVDCFTDCLEISKPLVIAEAIDDTYHFDTNESPPGVATLASTESESSFSTPVGILKAECKSSRSGSSVYNSVTSSCIASCDQNGLGSTACGGCSSTEKQVASNDTKPTCTRGHINSFGGPSDPSSKCMELKSSSCVSRVTPVDKGSSRKEAYPVLPLPAPKSKNELSQIRNSYSDEEIKQLLRQAEEDAEDVCTKMECGTEPSVIKSWDAEKIASFMKDGNPSQF